MENTDPFHLLDVLSSHNVPYVSLAWLRAMKKAAGRPKDLVDLEHLPPGASSCC